MILLFLFFAFAVAIWPIPSSYTSGSGTLWIDTSVQITYSGVGQQTSYGGNVSQNQIIQTAIANTRDTIIKKSFVPWRFHPRNTNFQPAANASRTYIKTISLSQNATDPADILKPLTGDIDESYSLSLLEDGTVKISAVTSIGLAHGLTTFTQLFYKHTDGGVYTALAPVTIHDAPKFQHRGLNLDISRAYYAPSDITRMIDALAYNKMNRLHLHASDSQSWPIEIPSLPLLASRGAYGAGLTYSPAVVQSIQQYGSNRGVEVIIELDMPGHTTSIAFGYPDLIAAFNVLPDWSEYAAEPPSGTLKLNSSAVSEFLNTLFDDLLPRVRPYSSYFHTGGDEVAVNAYTLDETVRSNDTKVLQPLVQAFVDRNHAQIRAAGLTPIVWEEMLLQWNLTLGSDVVVQTWISDQSVADAVKLGHKVLAGNYNFWYLDCGQGQFIDFLPGNSSSFYWPYADYCSPRKNWRLMYSYDPLSGVPANLTHLVLGGEAHMWSEQTDPINLDRQVWPRTCAAAEVLWSGAKDAQGHNRSQTEAQPRLAEMRERLVARGVMAEPVAMPFCTQNGTQCFL